MWHCSHSRFSVVVTDELVPIHLLICSHHLTMTTWAGWSMSAVSKAICMSLYVISSIVMYCVTLPVMLMLENIELPLSRPNDVQGRIGLAGLILHAAGVGLIDRSAVISGRYNKYHSLQLQNYYAHFPPLQHTHTFMQTQLCGTCHSNDHGCRGIVCWPWQEESCVIG